VSIGLGALLVLIGVPALFYPQLFWLGWSLWGVVLLIFGRRHPMVYDATPLDAGRRRLALVALAIFVLCFTFAPIANGGF
jgi:hypothetical protein